MEVKKLVMTVRNRYLKRAHVSERKFRQILRLFSEDLTATRISRILTINRNTVNRYVNIIKRENSPYV